MEWIEHLKLEYPLLNNIKFRKNPRTLKYYLLYGKIQSGKTSNIISICHLGQLYSQSNIIILPNNYEGYVQYKDRIQEYNLLYENFCRRKNISEIKPINLAFVGDSKKNNIKKIHSILSNKTNGTIISLGNYSELQILCDLFDKLTDNKIKSSVNLIIDEADTAYKDESTNFRPLFDKLLNISNRVFSISATTFKLWFIENKILTSNILILTPNINYKGIKDFSYHYIPQDNKSPKRGEHAMDNDTYFSEYIEKFKDKPLYIIEDREFHPHIILYRSSEILNEHHYQTQDFLTFNHPEITTVVFNGDGIKIYSPSLIDKTRIIINNITLYNKDCYFTNQNVPLKHVLEYFRMNGGAELFRTIVIISGKLANRMISFVSSSYKWHLTNMYLLTGSKPSCDDLLQMCRLCGVYKYDKIPLEFAATETIAKDLILADSIQDKLMKDAKKYNKKLCKYIETKEINKLELPKRKLVKRINYKLNIIVKNELTDKYKLRIIIRNSINGDIETQLYYAFIDVLTKKGRNIWHNKSDIVNDVIENYDFAKNSDQVNGNLNSIIKNKTEEIEEETNGILLMKREKNWLIKYKNI